MASLVHDTVAWLRFYTLLPIPPLPGEEALEGAPDLARTAHVVPVAGAAIGAIGAIMLIIAWALRLPPLLSATLAVAALVLATGALSERCVAQTSDRLAGSSSGAEGIGLYGLLTLVLALLLRVAALDGLIAFGALNAGLVLVAACAVARAAAVSFAPVPVESSPDGSGRLDVTAFQRLAVVALVIGAAAVLPTYGLGPAIAGLAAAVGAAAAVTALAPRFSEDEQRTLAGAAEQAAEIAFLIAVLVFAHSP